MAAKRDKVTREQHLALIADWIDEKGLKMGDMTKLAEVLGVDVSTVSRDIKGLMAQWRNSIEIKGKAAFERELFEHFRVYEEAWSEYERSKEPMKSQTIYKGEGKNFIQATQKERVGNPVFLQIALQARQQIIKLLGIEAPQEFVINGQITVRKAVEEMTDAELREYIASRGGSRTGEAGGSQPRIVASGSGSNIQH